MITQAYEKIIKSQHMTRDKSQEHIVDLLSNIQNELILHRNKKSFLKNPINLIKNQKNILGIYIWGDVGQGKTFLMDLFYQSLELKNKKRFHFHHLMQYVHKQLNSLSKKKDPIKIVAKNLTKETTVFCLDEFYVDDITDSMILSKLLEELFFRNITLITTSNYHPQKLYENGLQRQNFLPAIELLTNNTNIIKLDTNIDYRFQLFKNTGTYFKNECKHTQKNLLKYFLSVAEESPKNNISIKILGREIKAIKCASRIIWFKFNDICCDPRSHNDYIEIAKLYCTVIISEIPTLDYSKENEARRFIALIDEFYDRKVKLIISADTCIKEIYSGTKLKFEFKRTLSRIMEMQTETYLKEPYKSQL